MRNTYAGLAGLSPALLEAADALGMTPRQRLWRVELPNAFPVMLSGVRVALALNVGTAPLAFLIGASSYGELIFPGIYLNNHTALLLGAGATALIALALPGAGRRGPSGGRSRPGLIRTPAVARSDWRPHGGYP